MLVRVESVSRNSDAGPTSVLLRSIDNPSDYWQGTLAAPAPPELLQVGARFEFSWTLRPAAAAKPQP
jgi:hypothetical protein